MPKVSVLMPVYKTPENYLREAIESILNQTFTDFEFLILDDCPEDRREDIVKSYQDPRIKYYQNEVNLGISDARNRLLELAQGEYLAIFDHDDISKPARLEQQVAFLDQHPDYGVVSCQSFNIVSNTPYNIPCTDQEIKIGLMHGCPIQHSACMLRTSVLKEHDIRYESQYSPSEDYALFCCLIPYTKFYNLDEELFLYRDHEGNTSHQQQDRMRNATLAIYAMVRTAHPDLYQLYRYHVTERTKYKLFGRIRLFTVCRTYNCTKIYCFNNKVLLLKLEHSHELKL